ADEVAQRHAPRGEIAAMVDGRKLYLLAGSRRITARNRLEHFHLDQRDFARIGFDRVRAGAAEISIAFDPRPAISVACSSSCIGSDALAAIWMWSRWPHQLIGSRFAAASRGVTNVPLRSDDKRLFRRLPGRRPYALEPVRLGRRDRRSQHEPRLVRRPRPTAWHGRAVVPHDDVALAPSVDITQARRSRGIHELGEKFLRRRLFHALNRIGVRGKIERAAAVYRVPPHHAPALRRQRRALLRAG